MEYLLSDLASRLGGEVLGDGSYVVRSVSSPGQPEEGSVVVAMNEEVVKNIPETLPVIGLEGWLSRRSFGISVPDTRLAMAQLLGLFKPALEASVGVDPSAVVHPSASVAEDCFIGPLCVLSKGSKVGSGAVLRARVFIGENSSVGEYSVLEPGVTVYDRCHLGSRVIVHGNSVIGADGFGHIPPSGDRGIVKVPQIGGVIVEDDVEIGACSTVDRGTIGDTVLGAGTKVDNHVQIAHNVVIGRDCIVISQAGVAGSAVIEDRAILAARSGVQEHVKIGKGATVAACGGATKDVPPGAVVSGFPADDHRSVLKREALLRRLEDLFDRVKRLEKGPLKD